MIVKDKSINFLKKTFYKGEMVVESQYGLLPYARNLNPPQSNQIFHGGVGVKVLKVPMVIGFHYSSLGYISGINNYFTINFDANQFQKEKAKSQLKFGNLNKLKIDSLFQLKKDVNKSLSFLQHQIQIDSLQKDIQLKEIEINDSLPNFNKPKYSFTGDSLVSKRNDLVANLVQIEKLINGYQKLEEESKLEVDTSKKLFPNTLLSSIKVFQVGLCRPNYSSFLIARAPIIGLNLEYQLRKFFIGISSGKTQTNSRDLTNAGLDTRNEIGGWKSLLGIPQSPEGNFVNSLKLGLGKKQDSHIYVGGLYGTRNKAVNLQRGSTERNYVLEIDGLLKFNKDHKISAVLAKSYLTKSNLEALDQTIYPRNIFDKNRSYAAKVAIDGKLFNSKTSYSMEFRIVDPYFKSYGVGFLQSDNTSFRGKVSHKLSKKIKFSFSMRNRKDDLLGLNGVSNSLKSYKAGLSLKPLKGLNMKMNYNPFELISKSNNAVIYHSRNEIYSFMSSYSKRKKKITTTYMGLWMHYVMDNGLVNHTYDNLTFSISKLLGKSLTVNANVTSFIGDQQMKDNSEVLVGINSSYKKEKCQLSLGVKNSFNVVNGMTDFGGSIVGRYYFKKWLAMQLRMEKIIKGSYYENIMGNAFFGDNYRFNLSLQIRW